MSINLKTDHLERDGPKTETQETETLLIFGRNKEAEVMIITDIPLLIMGILLPYLFTVWYSWVPDKVHPIYTAHLDQCKW